MRYGYTKKQTWSSMCHAFRQEAQAGWEKSQGRPEERSIPGLSGWEGGGCCL